MMYCFRLNHISQPVNDVLFQVEPYLTTLALFDAKQGRKLTENFHFDVNHLQVRNMVPCVSKNGSDDKCGTLLPSELQQVPEEWLMYPKQVIITRHIQQDMIETVGNNLVVGVEHEKTRK